MKTISSEISSSHISIPTPLSTNPWDLTEEEWERHDYLMEGIRGRLSVPEISPIEVLGIHARNDAERKHYATLWARMMREDAIRVLKFQRAYDEAVQLLGQGELLIDPDRIPAKDSGDSELMATDDRIMIFVSLDCVVCDVILKKIINMYQGVTVIDIYLVNADSLTRQEIAEWAKKNQIASERVASKWIAINHDNGLLKTLVSEVDRLPYLFRNRQGSIETLPAKLIP